MLDINENIISSTINNGLIILDENLNICSWNKWLEIRTNIKRDDILNKNICEEFPYINEKKLKRKIKSVLVTKNPSFYSVDPHCYLIKIQVNSIVDKIFEYMQQDITIIPYDVEKKLVCLYIYDNTELNESNLKLKILNKELKELSNKDPMTNTYNRRYFSEISQKYLILSRRNEQDLSILILDIDHFKKINDTYGHNTGDEVIITLAECLKNCLRKSDIVSRFGGEEFVILLYGVCKNNTSQIAENMRKNIEKLVISNEKVDLKFTVSIGGACYDETKDDENLDKTLTRADHALYEAKNKGRNRIIIAN